MNRFRNMPAGRKEVTMKKMLFVMICLLSVGSTLFFCCTDMFGSEDTSTIEPPKKTDFAVVEDLGNSFKAASLEEGENPCILEEEKTNEATTEILETELDASVEDANEEVDKKVSAPVDAKEKAEPEITVSSEWKSSDQKEKREADTTDQSAKLKAATSDRDVKSDMKPASDKETVEKNASVQGKTEEKNTEDTTPTVQPVTKAVVEEKTETKPKTPTKHKTEKPTETQECKHIWVWSTHTETVVIPEVSHEEPVYNDGWDEAITVRKIYCSECQNIYEDLDDYYDHDFCFGSFGHMTVVDHYVHHEPELLYYDTIVDEPERRECVIVKDYEYCSICNKHK